MSSCHFRMDLPQPLSKLSWLSVAIDYTLPTISDGAGIDKAYFHRYISDLYEWLISETEKYLWRVVILVSIILWIINHFLNSGSSVLPQVLFEYKGSRAPHSVAWPKDYQVICSVQRQLDFLFTNYKGACEQAGTLFELTPTKLHLQITNQVMGTKRPVSSNVLWEKLTDTAKEGFKEGLGDILLVEVIVDSQVESSGEISYYASSQSHSKQWIVSSSPGSFRI